MGRLVAALAVGAHPATLARLRPVQADVLSAVRSQSHDLVERPDLSPGTFEVLRCELVAASASG